MTSADLVEEYAAVPVEWHETVKNGVLKIAFATFSYKHQLKILAAAKSLGQETTEVRQDTVWIRYIRIQWKHMGMLDGDDAWRECNLYALKQH